MSVTKTNNTSTSQSLQTWNRKQCTEKAFRDLLAEKVILLAQDAFERMAGYPDNLAVLKKGFWYPNDYFEALQHHKQQPRIEFFKKRGDFIHGYPPKGFKHVTDSDASSCTGKKLGEYKLADGISAVEALNNVKESLCFIDCMTMLEVAYYETFLHIFGKEWFNAYFDAKGGNALQLKPDFSSTPLTKFVSTLDAVDLQKGDIVYFRNLPSYGYRHIHGETSGFNTCCIQDGTTPLFTGFGLNPKGLSEEEILDLCVTEFNKEPLAPNTICMPEVEHKIVEGFLNHPTRERTEEEQRYEEAKKWQISKEIIKKEHATNPKIAGRNPLVVYPNMRTIQAIFKK
jgi:hypothetical protein